MGIVMFTVLHSNAAHSRQVSALSDSEALKTTDKQVDARSVVDKILPIGTTYQNNITLLNNRFRIDAGVDKVILVFFREFGAQPIVLVQPDGSKLYLDNDMNDDSYHWYESDTYDMIELTQPMPGPWQALGQILPSSRVMVIADLVLEAEPIPSPLFAGETIKHTAFLRNAGERVNFKEFRDVVALSIDFISTNHPDYENFGLGAKNIARFEDDGVGLDERAGDGTFTGQFNLNISNGEWQPIVSVRTPLFSREQSGEKVMLLPNPIVITHEQSEDDKGFHRILVNVESEHIAPGSLMLDGTIRTPEGEPERFSLTELGTHQRQLSVVNAGFGMYRTNMTAYAKTLGGRDIVINVPEYSFITREPVIEVTIDEASQDDMTETNLMPQSNEEEDDSSVIIWVLSLNLIIILIGAGVIYVIADKRKHPDAHIGLKVGGFFKNMMGKLPLKKAPKKESA